MHASVRRHPRRGDRADGEDHYDDDQLDQREAPHADASSQSHGETVTKPVIGATVTVTIAVPAVKV
ncbi:hypothetical protein D3C83_316240 [compost metagenome]